jgi:hypothetical protein
MDSSNAQSSEMQQPPMAQPQAEHKWLEKLVGSWRYEMDASAAPGSEPIKVSGEETVRSLDGIWFVGEGTCPGMDGKPAQTMITLGYDPAQKCYVGSWVGSMMTQLWTYKGQVSGNTLTLDTVGPRFDGQPGGASYQDIVEFVNDDHRVLRSQIQGDDGNWTQFMEAHYHRVK